MEKIPNQEDNGDRGAEQRHDEVMKIIGNRITQKINNYINCMDRFKRLTFGEISWSVSGENMSKNTNKPT